MRTMVCFQAAGAAYCLPVEATRGVRASSGMIVLPAARPDVAGLMPGDPPLTVISPLGAGGGHILVVESGDTTFGLLVDKVSGLRRVEDAEVRVAPRGQDRGLVSGTLADGDHLIMVADADALAERL
jgi:chemotaxis signal transduction protein